jgi:hypothetical protein
VGVAVPGDEVLQRELVDPVVCSAAMRSVSACRFWLSRVSGAEYAAWVENTRLSRMNG